MRKFKVLLIASILLNLFLGFLLFENWRSRTVSYMHSYENLMSSNISLTNSTSNYLETGNSFSLGKALGHSQAAMVDSNIFFNYFQDNLSYELGNELTKFYNYISLRISEVSNNSQLEEIVNDLQLLTKAMSMDKHIWRYDTIPSHPVNKKQVNILLDTVKEINKALIQ